MDDAEPTRDDTRVCLPRWVVRATLGLCPYFALLIGGHAAATMWLDQSQGIGWFLTWVFWLGVLGFSLTVTVLGLLYLRLEPGLSAAARRRIGAAFAIVMLTVAGLAAANMAAP